MIAWHEHAEMESSPWLSPDIREDLPSLSVLDGHETQHATVAYDADFFSTLVQGDPTWEVADAAEAPLEDAPASAMPLDWCST